ncbi:BTAD domain-containing putative transcriptional regulator [Actinoplanes sp. NPDC049596]|uniref:AfsR/SARP family transcriptional regulator n=1 Tax=unclassified Actinoplanes TaxID=2626549 RepID=UPI00342E2536
MIRLQVLGPLRLWRGGAEVDGGPPQQRCLLALLLIRAGRPVSVTELVRLLWGTEPPASAVNVIHKYVGVLRRLLEPGLPPRSAGSYLLRHGAGYRFALPDEALDLALFRRLASAARAGATVDGYRRALDHFRGPAGEGLADSPTAAAAFAAVDAELFETVIAAADLAVRHGRAADLLPPLRMAADIGRLHEPVHTALITTLAAAGHRAEALARYRTIRDRLTTELGLEPGPALTAAWHKAHNRSTSPTAAPPVPGVAPPVPSAASSVPGASPLVPAMPIVGRPAPGVAQAVTVAAGDARWRPGSGQLPPEPPLFVGRRIELGLLQDLYAGMRDGGRPGPMVIAVDGVGGVGKSAVVARFAQAVAGDFSDGQLFLDLRGDQGLEGGVPAGEALRSLLYGLGDRAPEIPDTFDERVAAYNGLTAGRRLLVVLDNARDSSQVRPLLPNSPDSLVLITSRRPLLGLAASSGACLLELEPLSRAEARELLTARRACDQSPARFAATRGLSEREVDTQGARQGEVGVPGPDPWDAGQGEAGGQWTGARDAGQGEVGAHGAGARDAGSTGLGAPGVSPREGGRRDLGGGEWGIGMLDEVAERCGRLPLALTVMAARLAGSGGPAGSHRGEPVWAAGPEEGEAGGVFGWAYRRLGSGAARLFRLLSLVPYPGATVAACASLAGQDAERTGEELAELERAALVGADRGGRFASPGVIREYAGELLRTTDSRPERRAALCRLLQHYLHSSVAAGRVFDPAGVPVAVPRAAAGVVAERFDAYGQALDWFALHRDVLTGVVRLAAEAGCGIAPWQLAVTLRGYLERCGFRPDGEDVMRVALRAAREQGDVVGEAHALRGLAAARAAAGADEEARDLIAAAVIGEGLDRVPRAVG